VRKLWCAAPIRKEKKGKEEIVFLLRPEDRAILLTREAKEGNVPTFRRDGKKERDSHSA